MVTGKIEPCISSEGDCNLPFFFRSQLTYMYEIKALHCGKCFLLFVTHNGMIMLLHAFFGFLKNHYIPKGGGRESRFKQRIFLCKLLTYLY